MSRLATEAELVKLGRVLDVEPAELAFLDGVAAAQLRSLRIAVHERTFDQDRTLFERLAFFVGRLPTQLTAILAQRAGPLLTARVAGEMPPGRAAAVAARLPVAFQADVSADLDPRRTTELIVRLPLDRTIAVTLTMVERGDHVTLSRFVDVLPDATIRACMDAIDDEAALLLIAFFMGSKDRLDDLFRMLARTRRERLVARVADEPHRLLRPFAALLANVGKELRDELCELAAACLDTTHAERVMADVAAERRGLR